MTDIKAKEWYAEISVTGSNESTKFRQGSLVSITDIGLDLFALMQQVKPKKLIGGKRITITLSDSPMESELSAAEKVAFRGVDLSDQISRREGETWDELYQRFLEDGFPPPSAAYFTNDCFGLPQDPQTTRWINDPKAQQWSRLQVNPTAFAEAMKGEYETLSRYIKAEYPERAALITFKVAI